MRKSTRRRSLVAVVSASLAAFALVAFSVTPAYAAPATTVGIAQIGADTQPSGDDFTYRVAFQCSNVDDPPDACEDVEVRIPLGDAADFDIDVPGRTSPDQWYIDDATGELVIVLGDVAPGTSTTVDFTVTPPNNTTPDGTEWTFAPTAVSSNAETGSGPLPSPYEPSVSSTATAALHNTVSKTLNGSVFREPGELVTWTVTAACTQTSSGNVFASELSVVDTLPEGLTYVSSNPAGTAAGQTVTWNLPGAADLPTSCTDAGARGTVTFEVTARVDDDFEPENGAERVTNVVESEATGIGGEEGDPVRDTSAITVTDDPSTSPGHLGKESFGQLTDTGEVATSDSSHTTYPGAWNGYYDQQPGNVMSGYKPNEDTDYEQSGYKLRYRTDTQVLGYQVELQEPMPCFADGDASDVIHASLEPGERCAQDDLAFHVTTVSVWVHNPANYGLPAISTDYHPTATLASDGSTIDLVQTGTRGDSWMNFAVPTEYIGEIAEVDFPRDAGIASDDVRWGIFGYADTANVAGDIVRNTGTVTSYFEDATTPSGAPENHSADLFIVDTAAIGIEKQIVQSTAQPGADVTMNLTANLSTPGTVTSDLVITDLLPDGFTWAEPSDTIATTLTATWIPDGTPSGQIVEIPVTLGVEVIDNFQGTGRQLLRVRVPGAPVEPFGSIQGTVPLQFVLTAPTQPGVYTNTAQVFYDSEDLSTACNQVPYYEQLATDPLDLDGNANTDRYCQGQDDLTVVAPTGSADFELIKTVQGDTDAGPRRPPAVGMVTQEGGSATFGLTWRNTGAATLEDVVLYDIFPRVGDTGVSGSQAGASRGSEFTATFQQVQTPLPDGVTVEYTQAENPCRSEVYPGQGDCVDDWSTTEQTDAASVTGIRITSDQSYATGDGFTVNVDMTTPEIERGQVAWNSVAGVATDAANGTPLLPAEPPKVGITAYDPDVPPFLQKTSDVESAGPGDPVTYTLTVTNPGAWTQEDVDLTDELPAGLTFVSASGDPTVDGQTITWAPFDLAPWEVKTFTVVATVDANASGTLWNVATIPGAITPDPCDIDADAACAPVDVLDGELTVSKTVAGEGAQFAPESFDIVVDCRVDGASALGFPQTVTLAGGATSDAIDAPIGSVCTAVEPDTQGATSVTVSPADGVEITSAESDAFTLDVVNTYDVGGLQVAKTIVGDGAEYFGTGPFTFDAVCTFNGETVVSASTQLEVDPSIGEGLSEVLRPIPLGAECVVTESDTAGADEAPAPVTVTIVADEETDNVVTAAFTNAFSAASVEVTKELAGTAAEDDEVTSLTFTLLVTCQIPLEDSLGTLFSGEVGVRGGETFTLVDAEDQPFLLPLGARCFVEETDAQGADDVIIEHDSYENGAEVTVGDDQLLALAVTNVFDRVEPTPTPTPSPSDGGAAAGELPASGGTLSGLWILGGMAVLVGVALVIRRRRA